MLLDQPGRRCGPPRSTSPCRSPGQLRLRVEACGVCRTDLHLRDGELAARHLPLVSDTRSSARTRTGGGSACRGWAGRAGSARYCASGRENLCVRRASPAATSTAATPSGRSPTSASASTLPDDADALQLAPLLCGGLIGHRALRLAGDGERLGFYGFGAAAHIICQVASRRGPAGVRVHARRRRGRAGAGALARRRVGGRRDDAGAGAARRRADLRARSARSCPRRCAAVAPGGTVVCAGIHMSDIPSFPYADLWEERVLRSVANLTRARRRGVPRPGPAGAGASDGDAVRPRGGRGGADAPCRRAGGRGRAPVYLADRGVLGLRCCR